MTLPAPFGNYRFHRYLGSGGCGTTYVGMNKITKKQVYIKSIDIRNYNEEEQQSLAKEAHILASLSHPNIIKFIDHFSGDGSFYIVMEFADWGTLSDLIQKSPQLLSKDVILSIVEQLLRGIHYLHTHGVIHRDLKPSNILITNKFEIKICDFGLSKIVETVQSKGSKSIVGTPQYMAPEYFLNEPITDKVDVWSFGCILYEILFKRPTFEAINICTACNFITNTEPNIPESNFSELLSRLFTKNSEERPSILEIYKLLFKNKISETQESNPSETLSDFIQRHFPQNTQTNDTSDDDSYYIFTFALSKIF
jgi:serine/threonine protein kinase